MSNEKKFYDIRPDGRNDSHYLCENGMPIARFEDIWQAEATRDNFMRMEAQRYERSVECAMEGQEGMEL